MGLIVGGLLVSVLAFVAYAAARGRLPHQLAALAGHDAPAAVKK